MLHAAVKRATIRSLWPANSRQVQTDSVITLNSQLYQLANSCRTSCYQRFSVVLIVAVSQQRANTKPVTNGLTQNRMIQFLFWRRMLSDAFSFSNCTPVIGSHYLLWIVTPSTQFCEHYTAPVITVPSRVACQVIFTPHMSTLVSVHVVQWRDNSQTQLASR